MELVCKVLVGAEWGCRFAVHRCLAWRVCRKGWHSWGKLGAISQREREPLHLKSPNHRGTSSLHSYLEPLRWSLRAGHLCCNPSKTNETVSEVGILIVGMYLLILIAFDAT